MILFRAKAKEWKDSANVDKTWKYGGYYYVSNFHFIVEKSGDHIEVDKDTVCQFTGQYCQNEKVFNKDIFEFDIREWGGNDNIHVVSWNNQNAEWSWGGGSTCDMDWRKIIGNTIDNPELLNR